MFGMVEEVAREAAIDLGCTPGPIALLLAGSLNPARLSDAAELDLIGLVERSIIVAHALRSTLIADYADRAPFDPTTEAEQRAMNWHREQLAVVCQTSPHEADVRCRTAVALRERLPATAAAVQTGSLPWAQAVVLARESRDLDPLASSAVERIVLADRRAVSVRDVRDATRADPHGRTYDTPPSTAAIRPWTHDPPMLAPPQEPAPPPPTIGPGRSEAPAIDNAGERPPF